MSGIPALQSVAILPSLIPGSDGLPFQFVLKDEGRNYAKLDLLSNAMLRKLRQSGLFLFVTKNLRYDAPQIKLQVDREQMRKAGISASDVDYTLHLAYADAKLQPFIYHGRTYNVMLSIKGVDHSNYKH